MTDDGITISAVTPDHGPATGDTAMMIVGSGFPEYPVVTVGGRPAPVLSRSRASLTVSTPGGDAGTTVDVTVADRVDRSVTMRNAFRYDGTATADPAPTTPGDPGNDSPGSDGPGSDGPGSDGPGSDGPGSDGPGSDGPGSDGPGSDGPGSDGPSTDNPAPTGPAGTTYRPAPIVGPDGVQNGLRLALFLDNNPLGAWQPGRWPQHRCTKPACPAVAVR